MFVLKQIVIVCKKTTKYILYELIISFCVKIMLYSPCSLWQIKNNGEGNISFFKSSVCSWTLTHLEVKAFVFKVKFLAKDGLQKLNCSFFMQDFMYFSFPNKLNLIFCKTNLKIL